MTAQLQPNTTQIPHIILREWMPVLSDTEFRIIMVIADQTYGWHKESDRIAYSLLIVKTGSSNGSIATSLRSLREKGYIQVTDVNGKIILTKEEARGKNLYYRINVKTPKIGVDLSKNRTPKIGDTKETNTKALPKGNGGIVKKQPSCPLLNGSPLSAKYKQGHMECVEYLQDEESKRGFKFINHAKQYLAIHKILKAGYGFDKMDKTIRLVEKRYTAHGWDYMTLANWLEKGSGNG